MKKFTLKYIILSAAVFSCVNVPAQTWSSVGGGIKIADYGVNTFAEYNGELYAAGNFTTAGG